MPGNLCRCDLLSEEGWALAMPVLLPITGRQCRPRAEGPPGRRSANTSWNIEDRPRLSFPITGCSCSLGGSNAIPGLVMATGFALRHSFWHLFRSNRLRIRRGGRGCTYSEPTFPPKSCSLSGVHSNTAICSGDCQGEQSITTNLLWRALTSWEICNHRMRQGC